VNDRDEKRLLNEILPAPLTANPAEGDPRQRTTKHLKKILAVSLALPLAATTSCGYLVVDPVPPPQVRPGPPGVLALKSTPIAEIEIDGKPTGLQTPQDKIELPPGIHTIKLTAGNLQQTFTVEISTGATVSYERDLRKPPPLK
jgi:hypothetical protein